MFADPVTPLPLRLFDKAAHFGLVQVLRNHKFGDDPEASGLGVVSQRDSAAGDARIGEFVGEVVTALLARSGSCDRRDRIVVCNRGTLAGDGDWSRDADQHVDAPPAA